MMTYFGDQGSMGRESERDGAGSRRMTQNRILSASQHLRGGLPVPALKELYFCFSEQSCVSFWYFFLTR